MNRGIQKFVIAIVLDTPHGELDDGTDMSLAAASAAPVFPEPLVETCILAGCPNGG